MAATFLFMPRLPFKRVWLVVSTAVSAAGLLMLGACALPAASQSAQSPQSPPDIPSISAVAPDGPCCGPLTLKAQHLLAVLDASNVENLWQKSVHVAWDSGEPDLSPSDEAAFARIYHTDTHCSAYAAAIGQRLGVYLLRPPYHRQTFLASAQMAWLGSGAGAKGGWREVPSAEQAQVFANAGWLVVVGYEMPESAHKPGHIAVVRPDANRTLEQIRESGVVLTQAGNRNYLRITEKHGFRSHPGAWPSGVKYFAHALPTLPTLPTSPTSPTPVQ